MLVDTHCHLDAAEFDADRPAVAGRARAAGVAGLVVPSVDRAGMAAVAALCGTLPGAAPAFGIHPMYAAAAAEADLAVLTGHLDATPAVAVGEIGLDRFDAAADREAQLGFFVAQLRIARDRDLPVLLHLRRAQDAVLKQLRRIAVPGGIAHAFNGSLQQAEAFIALGFKLGFGGTLGHPRALRIRDLARRLPLSAIVLETDAPDIPPAWRPGGRSEPADVAATAAVLAGLRGVPVEEVAAATTENACAVLPRLRTWLPAEG